MEGPQAKDRERETIFMCIPAPQPYPPSGKPRDAHETFKIISKTLSDIWPINHLKSLALMAAVSTKPSSSLSKASAPTLLHGNVGYNRQELSRRIQNQEWQLIWKFSEYQRSTTSLFFHIILYLRHFSEFLAHHRCSKMLLGLIALLNWQSKATKFI